MLHFKTEIFQNNMQFSFSIIQNSLCQCHLYISKLFDPYSIILLISDDNHSIFNYFCHNLFYLSLTSRAHTDQPALLGFLFQYFPVNFSQFLSFKLDIELEEFLCIFTGLFDYLLNGQSLNLCYYFYDLNYCARLVAKFSKSVYIAEVVWTILIVLLYRKSSFYHRKTSISCSDIAVRSCTFYQNSVKWDFLNHFKTFFSFE
jgi:hypothetical protein